MLKKNDIVILDITDITNLGYGVGRVNGQVVFVSDAVPMDRAEVKIIKVNRSYAIGKTIKIIKASEYRCDHFCDHGACKSCAYKSLSYSYELELKKKTISGAFLSEGLTDVEVESVTPSPRELAYRNKAQYPISIGKNGDYVIGFYAPKSHRVTDAASCPLAPAIFAKINSTLLQFFKKHSISVYDEESGKGLLRHIYLRRGEISGEVLLTLVISEEVLPHSEELVQLIVKGFPSVVGILLNVNDRDTNVILGDRYITLYGRDYIYDTLCGVDLKISAPSFYQVNHDAAELLYAKARELASLTKSDTLLDLFCGAGSIGLSMAEDCNELIGIEIIPEAVECARDNARRAHKDNARFFVGDASETEALLSDAEREIGRRILPDVIILDPPRAGCDEELVDFASRLNPRKIVYISCNPTTLARDVKRFYQNGYTCDKVYGFDLFPRTGHVESVVCLTRRLDVDMRR